MLKGSMPFNTLKLVFDLSRSCFQVLCMQGYTPLPQNDILEILHITAQIRSIQKVVIFPESYGFPGNNELEREMNKYHTMRFSYRYLKMRSREDVELEWWDGGREHAGILSFWACWDKIILRILGWHQRACWDIIEHAGIIVDHAVISLLRMLGLFRLVCSSNRSTHGVQWCTVLSSSKAVSSWESCWSTRLLGT